MLGQSSGVFLILLLLSNSIYIRLLDLFSRPLFEKSILVEDRLQCDKPLADLQQSNDARVNLIAIRNIA